MATKKHKTTRASSAIVRGFIPDFSKYLHKYYPLDDAYRNSALIEKLKRLVSELLTTQNPAQDLQQKGFCKKLELMRPKADREFLAKCNFPEGNIYYAAYGNTPYRIVFGIDTNLRTAYFFALDTKHSIRDSK